MTPLEFSQKHAHEKGITPEYAEAIREFLESQKGIKHSVGDALAMAGMSALLAMYHASKKPRK